MLVLAVLFVAIGGLIKYGKLYHFIVGFTYMPERERRRFNFDQIATVYRNTFFGMAAMVFVGYLITKFLNITSIEYTAFIVALIIGIPYLVFETFSKKYRINAEK